MTTIFDMIWVTKRHSETKERWYPRLVTNKHLWGGAADEISRLLWSLSWCIMMPARWWFSSCSIPASFTVQHLAFCCKQEPFLLCLLPFFLLLPFLPPPSLSVCARGVLIFHDLQLIAVLCSLMQSRLMPDCPSFGQWSSASWFLCPLMYPPHFGRQSLRAGVTTCSRLISSETPISF